MMMRKLPLLLVLLAATLPALLDSCCEPASKDSRPVIVDSLFQRSYGYDIDLAKNASNPPGTPPDSGYYPIYTVAIHNAGSQDDNFTLRFRSQYTLASGAPLGFDISQTVPANSTVLFRTPTALPDSITSRERITYASIQDTLPLMSYAYLGFFVATPDSTRLSIERPSISILHGAIDNGTEGCNTPAVETQIPLSSLPDR